jgi:hypothetical protein
MGPGATPGPGASLRSRRPQPAADEAISVLARTLRLRTTSSWTPDHRDRFTRMPAREQRRPLPPKGATQAVGWPTRDYPVTVFPARSR